AHPRDLFSVPCAAPRRAAALCDPGAGVVDAAFSRVPGRCHRACSVWIPGGIWATRRPMSLTAKQKQYLKGLAHGLEPVVQVGSKGISDGLIVQIREQLVAHELI